MYQIRIGCQLGYRAATPTPSVFILAPQAHARHMIVREALEATGASVGNEYRDLFGNRCRRITIAPGECNLRYEALACVPHHADEVRPEARQVPPAELPPEVLRFTLPSRYAENDKLLGFAWETFSKVPSGFLRAQAINEWVYKNIEYRRGSSRPDWSATDVLAHRYGVCRDRAHLVIALCRAFNMPARYAVSYLPDIDVPEDGLAMDFHAYSEVWLEGGWQIFDPQQLAPRKGRIFLASGLDAADAAFATLYGPAFLTKFSVFADPVNEKGEKLDLRLRPTLAPSVGPLSPPATPSVVVASASPAFV